MKKWASLITLCFFAFILLGLGGRGLEQFRSIPVPEKNFSAKVIDKTGTEVSVNFFSWEGQVYFAGYKGEGAFTVSFDKVNKAEFGEKTSKGKVKVRLYLKDGSVFEMEMDADKFFYGKTPLGNYRIKVSNVRIIEFR